MTDYNTIDQLIWVMRTFAHREGWVGASTAPAGGLVEVGICTAGDAFSVYARFDSDVIESHYTSRKCTADKLEQTISELVENVRDAPLRLVRLRAAEYAEDEIDPQRARDARDDAIRSAIAYYEAIGNKKMKKAIADAGQISRERLYQIR